jgi:hypothetical protein
MTPDRPAWVDSPDGEETLAEEAAADDGLRPSWAPLIDNRLRPLEHSRHESLLTTGSAP